MCPAYNSIRGNIGGRLGFAHLASYMCPEQVPIGHSLTPSRLRSGYDPEALPRVPMPSTRAELVVTLARFLFRDKFVMLLTQGLGRQTFHNRIVILVNEWTNSAAEMLANFAAENRLGTVVGQKTRGNVLGAANFRVGSGYGYGYRSSAGSRPKARLLGAMALNPMCRWRSPRRHSLKERTLN